MSGRVIVKFNNMDDFIRLLRVRGRDLAVAGVAVRVREAAQERAPVRSGSARDGFYIRSAQLDEYGDAAGKAQADNPQVRIVPPSPRPEPGSGTAYVGNATQHALYLEFGTRHMAAQPSLIPALEAVRGKIPDEAKQALAAIIGEVRRP